jgi:hypothetical protein
MYTFSESPGRFLAWESDVHRVIINLDHVRQFFQKGNTLTVYWSNDKPDSYQFENESAIVAMSGCSIACEKIMRVLEG